MTFVSLLAVALVTGVFCGTVGVGGILVIPAMVLFGGLSIHQSTATALFSFVFLGAQGAWLFQQRGSIDWRLTIPVCAGAIFFSFIGAMVSSMVAAAPLNMIISLLVIVSGVYILMPSKRSGGNCRDGASTRDQWLLLGVGAVSGFGSGLSGAGGPLFSVPLMLLLGFAALPAIATSQVLVAISSASATLGNLAYGSIHFLAAAWITPPLLLGMYLGVKIAHRVKADYLRNLVAAFCIVLGIMMLTGIR